MTVGGGNWLVAGPSSKPCCRPKGGSSASTCCVAASCCEGGDPGTKLTQSGILAPPRRPCVASCECSSAPEGACARCSCDCGCASCWCAASVGVWPGVPRGRSACASAVSAAADRGACVHGICVINTAASSSASGIAACVAITPSRSTSSGSTRGSLDTRVVDGGVHSACGCAAGVAVCSSCSPGNAPPGPRCGGLRESERSCRRGAEAGAPSRSLSSLSPSSTACRRAGCRGGVGCVGSGGLPSEFSKLWAAVRKPSPSLGCCCCVCCVCGSCRSQPCRGDSSYVSPPPPRGRPAASASSCDADTGGTSAHSASSAASTSAVSPPAPSAPETPAAPPSSVTWP